jgi:ABC-type spermidine/putrescine transport system permease subunit I
MVQYLPGVSFVLGLWLLVAPYALGFTDQTHAFWNSLVVGAVSTVAGLLAGYQEWWHPTTKKA